MHDKALSILVYEIKDISAAQDYCDQYAKDMSDLEKSNIYTILLKIYLTPAPG